MLLVVVYSNLPKIMFIYTFCKIYFCKIFFVEYTYSFLAKNDFFETTCQNCKGFPALLIDQAGQPNRSARQFLVYRLASSNNG